MSHHGGKWPGRLASLCGEITGEFEDEEMELYREAYEENRKEGDTVSAIGRILMYYLYITNITWNLPSQHIKTSVEWIHNFISPQLLLLN